VAPAGVEHLLAVGRAFVVELAVVEAVSLAVDFAEAFAAVVVGIGEAVEFAVVADTVLVEAFEVYRV
jgi:hypothetical protein